MTFNMYIPIDNEDIDQINIGLTPEIPAYYTLDQLIDKHGEDQLYMVLKFRNLSFERKYGIGFFEN